MAAAPRAEAGAGRGRDASPPTPVAAGLVVNEEIVGHAGADRPASPPVSAGDDAGDDAPPLTTSAPPERLAYPAEE